MTLTVEHVVDDVVRLSMTTWRGRAVGYSVNAYVMRNVLVDSGFHRVRGEFMDAVRTLAPRGAILTHWHEDHGGNAEALARAGIPLIMRSGCEATLRERPSIAAYRRFVWGHFPRLTPPLVSFDPSPLEIIHAPGHCEDHLVVWDAERRMLATGDLFLGVKVRIAHRHESPTLILESLRRAVALEPEILLDAHRGVLRNGAALLRAKAEWMEGTIGEISALASAGIEEDEIRRRLLGREPFVGWVSVGEYSKRALVHAVLNDRALIAAGSASPRPPSARTSAAPSGW